MNTTVTAARPILDVGQALDLITVAIAQRRENGRPVGRSRQIISESLQLVGLDRASAERAQRRRLRDLYASRLLPIRLTLGAALALDAAQRSEWLGFSDELVLERAINAASRIPSLVSDRVLATATSQMRTSR